MNETWWLSEDDLDGEQQNVVDLPLSESHLITGPPGSGKTNLLLLRASYTNLAGHPNVLVVVFTRTLQEFIASGASNYSFSPTKVKTLRGWQHDFLREYGIATTSTVGADFDQQRTELCRQVSDLVTSRKLSGIYDAILLDEAQDFSRAEIEVFRRLTPRFFAVADSRQKIYAGESHLEYISTLVDNVRELKFHYRCGQKICRLADGVAKSPEHAHLLSTSNYDEQGRPSSVEVIRCNDVAQQAARIIDRLTVQLRAYPDELLGVIVPRQAELKAVWSVISSSPLASISLLQVPAEYTSFSEDRRICVCTAHSAKGLEFRALHIAGCEFFRRFGEQRNLAFMAITRAKSSLSLYHCGELPGFLEQALAVLSPVPDLPRMKDLFTKRR